MNSTPTPPSASAEKAIREALPVVAYLVTGGRIFRDHVVQFPETASKTVAERKDGSRSVELVLKSDAEAQLAELRAENERLTNRDPLQGAANWLYTGLVECTVADLQSRLLIGYNRAKRLFDAASLSSSSGRETS